MANVKVFTVTKDEYDLIEDFIVYHTSLFGSRSVVIIDNGSTDQRVLDVYDKYATDIELHVRPDYRGEMQGRHFSELMNRHKDADWLMGLDTDEFIGPPVNGKSTHGILDALLKTEVELVRYAAQLNCVFNGCCTYPAREIVEFSYVHSVALDKVFYRGSAFILTSVGNHDGKTTGITSKFQNGKLRDGKCGKIGIAEMCLLHFHDVGPARMKERAERICLAYGYCLREDSDEVRLQKLQALPSNVYGGHRVKQYIDFLHNVPYAQPMPVEVRYSGLRERLCEKLLL